MKRPSLLLIPVLAVLVAALPSTASTKPPAAPKVACSGATAEARRLDISIKGTATYGFYALPKGAPKGIVVFDHGYSHTAYSWRKHVVDTAKRDGVIAVAMDYRGSVDLPPATKGGLPQGRGWRVQEGAEDTVAVAQLFNRACPTASRIVIYGISMGGNTAGLAVALKAKRANGAPLFDDWFQIEGAANVVETYQSARALAGSGNVFAKNAQADIEAEMGGTFESTPQTYLDRTVVNRIDDIKASGIKDVFLVHGVADGLVPYDQSRELQAQLRRVGIAANMYSVVRHDEGSEPGTTIDGYAPIPGWNSPFAGHASESSDTSTVGNAGFDLLAQLFHGTLLSNCFELVYDQGTGTAGTVGCNP